ncbi:hypothetical protein HY772_06465 [Candidatus Woesearchaeota archaeon]|nr:hypothetical protein [Candidatus Woesearchaeota archaeon]
MPADVIKMKNKILIIGVLVLVILTSIQIVHAAVGVGISPSKIVLQIEGGKMQEIDLLVFNSGDSPLEISLSSEGDIVKFTEIEPKSVVLEPEPQPHALPIKNGRTFIVKFTPPAMGEVKKYTGTISATGKPAAGSQFGGSVGVATQVELIVTPPASIFAFITTTHLIIAGIIILIIIIILLLKKSGFRLKIEKK